jgi:hypothetical protein
MTTHHREAAPIIFYKPRSVSDADEEGDGDQGVDGFMQVRTARCVLGDARAVVNTREEGADWPRRSIRQRSAGGPDPRRERITVALGIQILVRPRAAPGPQQSNDDHDR